MKKLALLSVILLVGITSFAGTVGENYCLITTGEKLYLKKIRVEDANVSATLVDGKKIVIPASQVKMYQVDGEIFEMLPIYVNNENTGKETFMQFVTTRAGLKLYKYTMREDKINEKTGAHEKGSKVEHFMVFRGDQFYIEINDKNSENLFSFFGVN